MCRSPPATPAHAQRCATTAQEQQLPPQLHPRRPHGPRNVATAHDFAELSTWILDPCLWSYDGFDVAGDMARPAERACRLSREWPTPRSAADDGAVVQDVALTFAARVGAHGDSDGSAGVDPGEVFAIFDGPSNGRCSI